MSEGKKAEIKPCPFCGGTDLKAERVEIIHASRVVCLTCGGQVHTMMDVDEAKIRWNHRAQSDAALQASIAELEEYADKLAAGLPDGMLPKDVEVLRYANGKMATRIELLERRLKTYRDNYAADKKTYKLCKATIVGQEEEIAALKSELAERVSVDEMKEWARQWLINGEFVVCMAGDVKLGILAWKRMQAENAGSHRQEGAGK